MDLLAKHYLSYNNMFGGEQNNMRVDRGIRKSPLRSSIKRTASQKRSPSAPSPRSSIRHHAPLAATEVDGAAANANTKVALSPRLSSRHLTTTDSEDSLPTSLDEDSKDVGGKKQSGSRKHITLLQRLKSSSSQKIAEIFLTLQYFTSSGSLSVKVENAKNLPQSVDSFVKLVVLDSNRLLDIKETQIVPNTAAPEYNRSYVFDLERCSIACVTLVVEAWGHDADGEELLLGSVDLGLEVGGAGTAHWMRMMKQAGFPCAMWLRLASLDREIA